jgi:adenylate cyclase
MNEAFARNPAQPGPYRVAPALWHLAHGRDEQALFEVRRMGTPFLHYCQILEAVALARLGRKSEAERVVQKLLALDPEFGGHIEADLETRHLHPDLIEMLVDGLRRAGLPGTMQRVGKRTREDLSDARH